MRDENSPAFEKTLRKNLSSQKWRLSNLYWIADKEGKEVLFKMNWAQQLLYNALWYCNLVLKARQWGVTTFFCIYFLDTCLFVPNTMAGIIAHNREDAEDFFENKVKFAYDRLPALVRKLFPATRDSTRMLKFQNGSSIKVGTSMRSGTLQLLHISEFGKICAKMPKKAKEIVTGALNTIQAGQFIGIESTAEGQHGYFFDYCKKAQDMEKEGKPLTPMDFRFFFFGWHQHEDYQLDPEHVLIDSEFAEYFQELEDKHGIILTDRQKAWYVKKSETQGEDMKREYPSTPDEAFEASIKGAYYSKQMTKLRKDKRICRVPYEPTIPVNTAWDLGMDDSMAIWFHQRVGLENRIIDYYENNGEGLAHYAKVIQDKGYLLGEHFLPHDVQVRELGTGKSRLETLEKLGFRRITTISRELDLEDMEGVEAVRNFLNSCYFDAVKCAKGIKSLDGFQKAWDENAGGFKARPLKNFAIHGADAMKSLALGYSPKRVTATTKKRRRDGRVV